MNTKLRKDLCAESLIQNLRTSFEKIQDPRSQKNTISFTDCLMSCFAVFSLKWPSLLAYDEGKRDPHIAHNLQSLFRIQNAPSDTLMRERLDELNPSLLKPSFKKVFAIAQRGKDLEPYQYLNKKYLVSNDATGHFSSSKVHCKNCCTKKYKDGSCTYHHQMLSAVMVHPDHKAVIPLGIEEIHKQDGDSKNDCERNAVRRLLETLRRHHPHLEIIVVEDALYANGPHLRLLKDLNMDYIIGAKPDDHKFLFDWVKHETTHNFEYTDKTGTQHRFCFINQVPLNDTHFDLKVNFLEYWEKNKKGEIKHFTWITNIEITIQHVTALMRGARARWRIENETFNTLKNQGYNFEHNYGHGKNHLCSVMAILMMLAFLIDQVQLLGCRLYGKAKQKARTFSALWYEMRTLFKYFFIPSWESFLQAIAETEVAHLNTS